MSNLKQLALGITQYTQDSDETFPSNASGSWLGPDPSSASAAGDWSNQIYPFVKSTGVYRCPDDSDWYSGRGQQSYGYMGDAWYDNNYWTPNGYDNACNNGCGGTNASLTMNGATARTGVNLSAITAPSTKGMLWDQECQWHDKDTNVKRVWAFVDGHVKYFRTVDAAPTNNTGVNAPTH